ncbi:type IX secretion system membrane protein PorP/SprF [soil metagenome]
MKFKFIFILSVVACSLLNAQDPFFTQYNSAPLALNPGFAGSTGQGRAGIAFRDQWPAISGNFVTTNISYDQYFSEIHGGLGLNFNNDRQGGGVLNDSRADLSYAFRMELADQRLIIQPALAVGFLHRHWDVNNLIFVTPEPITVTDKNVIDISSGFIAYTKRLTVGFAANHLTQPDIGFVGSSKLPMRFTIHASGVIGNVSDEFEKKLSVTPQVAFTTQKDFNQVNVGVTAMYSHFLLGVACRIDDALIGMIGFQNEYFRAAYSYDYTISALDNSETGGAHEITFQYFLFAGKKPVNFLAPAIPVF